MALANYADLVAAIGNWLQRTDYTAQAPDFIAMAEAEFNRVLRTVDMEGVSTATLTGEAVAVPSDFMGLRSMSYEGTAFQQITPSELFDMPTDMGGAPCYVAVMDGQFFFRPVPSSGTLKITYYQRIPALTVSNTTNWLMTRAPDLYLMASLVQAEFYGWNDKRLPMIKGRVDEILAQLIAENEKVRYGGRRLQAKPSAVPNVTPALRA